MSKLRLVLGSGNIAAYPRGGGHWAWFLQFVMGLRALGHEVFWIDRFSSEGDEEGERQKLEIFFRRAKLYGLDDRCGVFKCKKGKPADLESGQVIGMQEREIREIAKTADLFWNFACAFAEPLLSLFKHPVLLDVDPGHLQICAQEFADAGIPIPAHRTLLTVGSKMNAPGCEVPALGLSWQSFFPFVYLPLWEMREDPGPSAPFTSLTHWTWEELWVDNRILSVSKRAAYMRYLELPQRTGRAFALAASIGSPDPAGDQKLLEHHGWRVADPWQVAGSPEDYKTFIARSRAEILCPKPIFRELKTGWFSDRSVCYLASGRPVLAEETGFSERIPTGAGLLAYSNMAEAVAGVAEIDANYDRHRRAARELAENVFNSAICLPAMLSACGV